MGLLEIRKELKKHASKKHAKVSQWFFKTGPGEYAEGDVFIGVKVPAIREVAKRYQDAGFKEISLLLKSKIHEERLLALLILVLRYPRVEEKERVRIYRMYLSHSKHINNWDLVDLSAHHIVGAFLADKDKKPIYDFAKSKVLWERRIAILATFYYIRNNSFVDTLRIAKQLLSDKEDLIHKAVGWMLREVGKKDLAAEEKFLRKYYKMMPRTMLRYAIERFPETKRLAYLRGKI